MRVNTLLHTTRNMHETCRLLLSLRMMEPIWSEPLNLCGLVSMVNHLWSAMRLGYLPVFLHALLMPSMEQETQQYGQQRPTNSESYRSGRPWRNFRSVSHTPKSQPRAGWRSRSPANGLAAKPSNSGPQWRHASHRWYPWPLLFVSTAEKLLLLLVLIHNFNIMYM